MVFGRCDFLYKDEFYAIVAVIEFDAIVAVIEFDVIVAVIEFHAIVAVIEPNMLQDDEELKLEINSCIKNMPSKKNQA